MNNKIHWQHPILDTLRLTLRPITLNDAPAIYNYACKLQVARYMQWKPHKNIDETKQIINDIFLVNYHNHIYDPWDLCFKACPDQIIGTISLRPYTKLDHAMEIGYTLDNTYWGQGLIVEAAHCAIDYVVENLKIDTIVGIYQSDNYQSQRVCEKLNFVADPRIDTSKFIKDQMCQMKSMFWSKTVL